MLLKAYNYYWKSATYRRKIIFWLEEDTKFAVQLESMSKVAKNFELPIKQLITGNGTNSH